MAQKFQLLFLSGRDCSVSFLAKELLGVHDDADTIACYAGIEGKAIAPQVGRILDEIGIKSPPYDGGDNLYVTTLGGDVYKVSAVRLQRKWIVAEFPSAVTLC